MIASVVESSLVAVSVAVISKVDATSGTVVSSVVTASAVVLTKVAEEAEDGAKVDVSDAIVDSTDEGLSSKTC